MAKKLRKAWLVVFFSCLICGRAFPLDSFREDYYKILGIDPTATNDQIRSAFLAKIKQTHPDRAGNLLVEAAKTLSEAKTCLMNPACRRRFDDWLSQTSARSSRPEPTAQTAQRPAAPRRTDPRSAASQETRRRPTVQFWLKQISRFEIPRGGIFLENIAQPPSQTFRIVQMGSENLYALFFMERSGSGRHTGACSLNLKREKEKMEYFKSDEDKRKLVELIRQISRTHSLKVWDIPWSAVGDLRSFMDQMKALNPNYFSNILHVLHSDARGWMRRIEKKRPRFDFSNVLYSLYDSQVQSGTPAGSIAVLMLGMYLFDRSIMNRSFPLLSSAVEVAGGLVVGGTIASMKSLKDPSKAFTRTAFVTAIALSCAITLSQLASP